MVVLLPDSENLGGFRGCYTRFQKPLGQPSAYDKPTVGYPSLKPHPEHKDLEVSCLLVSSHFCAGWGNGQQQAGSRAGISKAVSWSSRDAFLRLETTLSFLLLSACMGRLQEARFCPGFVVGSQRLWHFNCLACKSKCARCKVMNKVNSFLGLFKQSELDTQV